MSACNLVAALHEPAPDSVPTASSEHGQSADLARPLDIDSCRADGYVVDECKQVDTVGIAIIHLDFRRYALLVDENLEADGT
jgi:hypothetical protein